MTSAARASFPSATFMCTTSTNDMALLSVRRPTLREPRAAGVGERGDVVAGVAELAQYVRRVRAERRRRRVMRDACAVDLQRQRERLDPRDLLDDPARARLLVRRRLRDVLDGRDRDAGERLEPVRRGALGEALA